MRVSGFIPSGFAALTHLPLKNKGRLFSGDRRSPLRTAGRFHRRGELCSPATNVILSAAKNPRNGCSTGGSFVAVLLRMTKKGKQRAIEGAGPYRVGEKRTAAPCRGRRPRRPAVFLFCHSERMRRIPRMKNKKTAPKGANVAPFGAAVFSWIRIRRCPRCGGGTPRPGCCSRR